MKIILKLTLLFSALFPALNVYAHGDASLLSGTVVHYEFEGRSLVTSNYANTLGGHILACNEIHDLLLENFFGPLGFTRTTVGSEPSLFQNGNVISVAGNCARTYWNDETMGAIPVHPPHSYFFACQGTGETIGPDGKCEVNPKNKGKCGEGNPISPGTGNKFQREVDIPIKQGSGFIRYYNSSTMSFSGNLGEGWTHNFSHEINAYVGSGGSISNASVSRPDGKIYHFMPNIALQWIPDADITDRLEIILGAADAHVGWRFITSNEVVEIYDAEGHLQSITEKNGDVTTLAYDINARLETVTDDYGHLLTFSYDENNRISTLMDANGEIYTYNYDANGNLEHVTYPDATPSNINDNPTRTYHYEDVTFTNHLTGMTDENNYRYVTWFYDSVGRVISSEHAGGQEKVSIVYNADGSSTVTDAKNNVRTYNYTTQFGVVKPVAITGDPCSSCGGQNAETGYDANGFINRRIDFNGNVTTYINDARGLELSRTEASGTLQARTILTEWHSQYRLPVKITRPSISSGKGAITFITYADTAHPRLPTNISRTGFNPDGSAVTPRAISIQYDNEGNVNEVNGPRTDVNDVTIMTYYPNESAQGSNRGQLETVENALGHTVSYDGYDAYGNVVQMTDANGVVTTYIYDARQRLLSMTETPLQGTPRTLSYTYDGLGQVLTTTTPEGIIVTNSYDAARYLISVTDNLNNRIEYSYDLNGNRNEELTKDPGGTLVRIVNYTHDARDRLESINAAGSITQLVFDIVGNLASQTDPNDNQSTTNNYDPLNRLMQSVDALSGTTTYDYDVNDRVINVTAPNLSNTQYAYDDLGNMVSEVSPDRGARNYIYNAAGNLLSLSDARNITASYSYDALGRVTAIDYPGTTEDVGFTYDAATACTLGVGRLCGMNDESGVTNYTYDAFANVVAQNKTELSIIYTTTYAYDAGDNVIRTTYPGGRVVNTNRDTVRRIASLTATVNSLEQPIISNVQYRADNLKTAQNFGNGVDEVRSYDLQGRLVSQTTPHSTVVDAVAPIVVAPDNIIVEATSVLTPVLLGSASANDETDGVLSVTVDNAGPFSFGTTLITWSATDGAGNIGTATQQVVVVDTIVPVLTVPANIEIESPNPLSVDIGQAIASDIFEPVSVSNDAPALFAIGATTVTWTATDAHGLLATAQQTVTVIVPADVVSPIVTAPAPIVIEASNVLTPVSLGTATAIDDIEGELAVLVDNIGPFLFGTTTINWSAMDSAGNVGTATQTVMVTDTTPPVLVLPDDVSVESLDGNPLSVSIGTATATDIFAPVTITNNAPALFPIGTTTVIWEATDVHGLITTEQQTVTVTAVTPTNVSVSASPQNIVIRRGETQSFVLYSANNTGQTAKRVRIIYKLPKGLKATSVETQPNARRSKIRSRKVILNWRNVPTGSAVTARVFFTATKPGNYVITSKKVLYRLVDGQRLNGVGESVTVNVTAASIVGSNSRGSNNNPLASLQRVANTVAPLRERHIVLVAPNKEGEQYNYLQYGSATGYVWKKIEQLDVVSSSPDMIIYTAKDYIDVWKKRTGRIRYSYQRIVRTSSLPVDDGELLKVAFASSAIDTKNYNYDANGNVLGITTPDGTHGYDYDALDRIVNDAMPNTDPTGLNYDANGNRLNDTQGLQSNNYGYSANSNQLDSINGQAINRDAVGNTTTDSSPVTGSTRTFEYNNANRLFKVYDSGSLVAQYTYNALGQRTRKVTPTDTTVYHYDLQGQLISETESDGRPIKDIIWQGIEPVAQIDVNGATDTITYLHTDHLATPRSGTDANGDVVWTWNSDAFGRAAASGSVLVNLRFPGQYYDSETQLHYNWFRYYDPRVGRYITSDPIGLLGGKNTFGYVGGNPLAYFDTLGLAPIPPTDKLVIARAVASGDLKTLKFLLDTVVNVSKTQRKKLIKACQKAKKDKLTRPNKNEKTLDQKDLDRRLHENLQRGENAKEGAPTDVSKTQSVAEILRAIFALFNR